MRWHGAEVKITTKKKKEPGAGVTTCELLASELTGRSRRLKAEAHCISESQ